MLGGKGMLSREEIQMKGQAYCDASLTHAEFGSFYSAWASMKTLINKLLVYQAGPLYLLSEEGVEIAQRIRAIATGTDEANIPPLGTSNQEISALQQALENEEWTNAPITFTPEDWSKYHTTHTIIDDDDEFGPWSPSTNNAVSSSSSSTRGKAVSTGKRANNSASSSTTTSKTLSKHALRSDDEFGVWGPPSNNSGSSSASVRGKGKSRAMGKTSNRTQDRSPPDDDDDFEAWGPPPSRELPPSREPPPIREPPPSRELPPTNLGSPSASNFQKVVSGFSWSEATSTSTSSALTPIGGHKDQPVNILSDSEDEKEDTKSSILMSSAQTQSLEAATERLAMSSSTSAGLKRAPSLYKLPVQSTLAATTTGNSQASRRVGSTVADIMQRAKSGSFRHSTSSLAKPVVSDHDPFTHLRSSSFRPPSAFNDPCAPSSIEKLATFQSVIFHPGSFEICLVLDTREVRTLSERDYINDKLRERGINVIRRTLDIGDMIWIAKLKSPTVTGFDELVLSYVVERKRMDDFVNSMVDGRFTEQKVRRWAGGRR